MSRTGYIKDSTETKRFDIVHTVKCLIMSYLLSVVLLFVLSVVAAAKDLGGETVNICITVITGISVIFCGFMTARGAVRGGLINGTAAGLLYTILLYAIGSIVNGSLAFNVATVTALIVGVVCGAVGGVLGINTRKRKR